MRTLILTCWITLLIVSFGLTSQQVWAHGGGGDIAVFTTDGQADVGFAVLDDMDINREFFDPEEDVFLSILIPITPNPIIPYEVGSSEPGFDAHAGDLPSLADINAAVVSLQYWDGAGDVAFTPAVGVSAGYAPQPLLTGADGAFHSHPTFGLSDETDDGQPVPEGVYLAKLQLNVTGLTDSDPFYLVTTVDDAILRASDSAEAGENVGEMVRNYLDDPTGNPAPMLDGVDFTYFANAVAYARAIPEPNSIALASLACAGAFAGMLRQRLTHRNI